MIPYFLLVVLGAWTLPQVYCRDPYRGTGYIASHFVYFADTDNLKQAPDNTEFVFILARHGISTPDSTCSDRFPNDKSYKDTWIKGYLTTHGRRLMHKLGRSLFTRYGDKVKQWGDEGIYISSIKKKYGSQSAEELKNGLLEKIAPGMININVDDLSWFDKWRLFINSEECSAYDWLACEVQEVDEPKNNAQWNDLFEFLSLKVGAKHDKHEWYMESPKNVYFLWQLLDCEASSFKRRHDWDTVKINSDIQTVVKEYFREAIRGDPESPQFVIGPMFYEMMSGFYNLKRKMHIHITEDRTFAAFKSLLLNSAMELPKFGDALIVEVYGDEHFMIHSYSPFTSNFIKGITLKDNNINDLFTDILRDVQSRVQFLGKFEWIKKCEDKRYIDALKRRIYDKTIGRPAFRGLMQWVTPKTNKDETRCERYPQSNRAHESSSSTVLP